jgi:hypothetical protein
VVRDVKHLSPAGKRRLIYPRQLPLPAQQLQSLEKPVCSSAFFSSLEYLERTHVYLSALITHRYGLRVGPEAMREAKR